MIRCPNCGSENHSRYRAPEPVEDVLFRRHRCLACRHLFATAQLVVTGALAEKLEEAVDRASEPGRD